MIRIDNVDSYNFEPVVIDQLTGLTYQLLMRTTALLESWGERAVAGWDPAVEIVVALMLDTDDPDALLEAARRGYETLGTYE